MFRVGVSFQVVLYLGPVPKNHPPVARVTSAPHVLGNMSAIKGNGRMFV